ncbi:MAG TPA: adenylate/guanylate cyclase domain-containing protein [Stellaceae bacterium]|nr:adenylate/guanylate cyclase domain-containing protein [Stellaceae bacterium]
MSAWRNAGLSTAVLILGLFLYVLDPPILRELQGRFFDVLQELKPREYVPLPVRVVDIDDASLERIGQWPWPRTVLAELVDRLHGLGAAAIAFDLVFAEPDRTSPARELQHLPNAPDAVSAWLSALPDNDASFASAIAEASVATGFVLTPAGGGHAPLLKAGWTEAGDDPDRFIERFRGAVANLPAIEAASAGNGSLNVTTSRAHVVRQVPMIVAYGNTIYPSLPAEALRLARHSDSYDVKASGANGATAFGKKTGISEIRIGDLVTETDPSGAITLYDTGVVPRRALPAWRVLEGRVAPQELRDAIVFVGISASGLGDLRPTPVARAMSGAEIQAQIAEQALTQVFLRRPDWARGAELVYLIALGGLLIFALPRIGAGWGALLAGAAVAGAFASAWYSFAALGLLFSPVYPTIVALCVYTTSSLVSQMDTEAEKNRIRHAFGQYLSPVLVEQLASDPSKLRLGGELRHMTFLFSDIRGFTFIAEQCKSRPEELTEVVNRFMTRMTDAILRHRGTIDKYIGDCIMAFWNAPLSEPDHASRACEAALAMRRELQALNAELAEEAKAAGLPSEFQLEAGIGINTGDCIVGNLGSRQRFDYSVLGDAVNLAARLEGESKNYGVPIIIGETTERLAGTFATLELDIVAVKGKRDATRLFALLGDHAVADDPAFRRLRSRHIEMLTAFRQAEWGRARALAQLCHGESGELAGLYDFYLARIGAGERIQSQVITADTAPHPAPPPATAPLGQAVWQVSPAGEA